MEIVSLVAIFALIKKAYDTLGFLTNRKITAFINQVVAFGLGIGAAFLAANANYFEKINLGNGVVLGTLNSAALVLVGLSWAGLAGVVGVDFIRARDNSQSAATPPVVPPPAGRVEPVTTS